MSDASREPIVSDWRGAANYQCPLCPFNTLNAELIVDHLRGSHPLPEGGEPTEPATDRLAASEPASVPADAPESSETSEPAQPDPEPVAQPELPPAPQPEPEAAVSHWATDSEQPA